MIIILVLLIGIGFFMLRGNSDSSGIKTDDVGSFGSVIEKSFVGEWGDIELKDIRTGEGFKINDFAGKPILLETFAVWCPTCLKQQRKIEELHSEIGDRVVSISLDTDESEDEAQIKEHINSNGLDRYFSVSPVDLTKALIEDFGPGVVSAPSAPVILICEDGSVSKLKSGVKDVEFLREAIGGCST